MNLTILIPAYNAEKFIEKTVEELLINFSDEEIIVINDGSTDKTLEKLQGFQDRIIIINHLKNEGKGLAIQNGFKKSTGEFVVFTDADLPYGIDNIKDMYNCLKETDNDLVIAYRKTFRENFFRHITHMGINIMIQVLFWFNVYDTQCGLKGFKRSFIDKVKGQLISKNFTIDIELLYLAKLYNMKMAKLLVYSRHINKNSTIRIKDIILILLEILKIRFNKNYIKK
jgi:dolichyl-phosphate beta-glucosyltransferase